MDQRLWITAEHALGLPLTPIKDGLAVNEAGSSARTGCFSQQRSGPPTTPTPRTGSTTRVGRGWHVRDEWGET
jgi:hypothetical protein